MGKIIVQSFVNYEQLKTICLLRFQGSTKDNSSSDNSSTLKQSSWQMVDACVFHVGNLDLNPILLTIVGSIVYL